GSDLDLATDPFHSDAAHKAGAAENLHRLGGAERHGLRGLVLQHADLGDRAFAMIEPPRQHFQHRLRGGDALRHVDQLVPDDLMLRQRLAEGVPLLAYSVASSTQTLAAAMQPAAMVSRSPLKLCVINRKPSPSSPSRFSAGTRQSSKCSVAVSDAHHPIFLSGVRDRPGVSPSITSRLTPPRPGPPVRTAVVM